MSARRLRLRDGPRIDRHPSDCGLPAAELTIDGHPHKAMGSMVALGAAWQPLPIGVGRRALEATRRAGR